MLRVNFFYFYFFGVSYVDIVVVKCSFDLVVNFKFNFLKIIWYYIWLYGYDNIMVVVCFNVYFWCGVF